jgi:predicted glycosyltransferase
MASRVALPPGGADSVLSVWRSHKRSLLVPACRERGPDRQAIRATARVTVPKQEIFR